MELLKLIDIAGIAVFSISGVFAAMEKKLDVFGVFIIAFITALGGGTLRDVLIGQLPVSWMYNLNYGLIVLLSTLASMFFSNIIGNYQKTLLTFDSLGIGLFTVVGIQKGIMLDFHPAVCIALGTITACFGGVIRDILLNNIPLIFQKEVYATACILGGVVYFVLMRLQMNEMITEMISITFIVVFRLVAVRFNWQLPSIYKIQKK
ncbi:MAG TPA: trimeric intracellular cation channel family protein [Bacteroidia bacterium]|nr:trimeric intracellular cation channel family protein [Bacteroidia bacterium]MBP7714919.1 trimeric intracellular cation channel family protein [Bacteroidia bacterium]MBP8668265.1 trimeric intracellular cation channel family protein [Bacteroidia bacterium]HOZ81876.1 trimeric intracellular cation channel family protein [Bacteroidia bacterium]HOZ90343.1 trimeric intracellular cation channel family protein [Bacteroidia bacterium]